MGVEKLADAMATTWVVSFSQVFNRDPVVADYLRFISCIECEAIPLLILPTIKPETNMTQAIAIPCAYAFAVRRGNEDQYDIHRLAQLEIRI